MQNVDNVSYAKPGVGGAIFVAPLGTALPTDANTALAAAYKALGYVNEDGLTNEQKMDTEPIKAWGGDVVLNINKGNEDTFKFTLIEMLNLDVLKTVFGADNVTGTLETGIQIKVNNAEIQSQIFVFDMILKDGALKRIVVPNASITEKGEIAYVDKDAVGYAITLTALSDTSGNTHYEYLNKTTQGTGE